MSRKSSQKPNPVDTSGSATCSTPLTVEWLDDSLVRATVKGLRDAWWLDRCDPSPTVIVAAFDGRFVILSVKSRKCNKVRRTGLFPKTREQILALIEMGNV